LIIFEITKFCSSLNIGTIFFVLYIYIIFKFYILLFLNVLLIFYVNSNCKSSKLYFPDDNNPFLIVRRSRWFYSGKFLSYDLSHIYDKSKTFPPNHAANPMHHFRDRRSRCIIRYSSEVRLSRSVCSVGNVRLIVAPRVRTRYEIRSMIYTLSSGYPVSSAIV